MERPNNIDQAFFERLHQAEKTAPAFVWPRIEAELKRKRRRMLLWWSFGTIALLGAASLVYMSQGNEATAIPTGNVETPVVAETTSPAAAPVEPAKEITPAENKPVVTEKTVAPKPAGKAEVLAAPAIKTTDAQPDKQSSLSTLEPIEPVAAANTPKEPMPVYPNIMAELPHRTARPVMIPCYRV